MAEYEVFVDTDPDPRDLVRELREALGLFVGALPYSPKRAWEEAIAEVGRLREQLRLATIDQAMAEADANDARLFLAIERTHNDG